MKTPPVCNYEGSDYQDRFWEKGNRAYEDAAEVLALKKILPSGSGNLLELGAGAGRNTLRYQGFDQITLLDYSSTQLQQAKDRLGDSVRYKYVAADVYRLPFAPGVFSAATMIRTLHHLSEPGIAIEQVSSCLSDNAVFILEFANKRNIKSVLRYIFKKQTWNPFDHDQVEFAELNFDFHPKQVKEMLSQANFNIYRQICVSYLRADFFKKSLPMPVLRTIEAVLQFGFSWTGYSPSIFLGTRVKNEIKLQSKDGVFFRCPACGHYPIADTPPVLKCSQCNREYPVNNGIYDFRID